MVLYTKPPKVSLTPLEDYNGKIIVIPFKQEEKDKEEKKPILEAYHKTLDEKLGLGLTEILDTGLFKADKGEMLEVPRNGKIYLLLGLGSKDPEESARRAFAKVSKKYLNKEQSIYLILEGLNGTTGFNALLGALLGSYALEEFKSEKKRKLTEIHVDKDVGLDRALIEAEGVYLARDVANAPPNEVYPEKLAEKVEQLFKEDERVTVKVLRYPELVEKGFGGIVNVGKGSVHKPVLIIIEYKGAEGKPRALVGKTLVFDSGGINIKPSHGMTSMRMDKAGGAAVLGATWITVRLGLPVNLVTLMPAAINVPGGESYLPSDVIKMWDGKRVEITNTDAEGRLVLADAIAYAAKHYDAEPIIELSTLTGAIVIALGPIVAGLFTRDEELKAKVEEASMETGEKVWAMPLVDEYNAYLGKTQLADTVNAATRWGGAICAALFLHKFTHEKKFVHLDIAGPGIGLEAGPAAPDYWPQGLGPGFGARLVAKVLEKLSNQ